MSDARHLAELLNEVQRLTSYSGKLELDVSGLKGTISQQVDLIHSLQDQNKTPEPAPDRLVEAAWCREYRPAGLVEMSNPKARIAELEAERDKMTALFNYRCREAKLEVAESRAIAFEEARDSARALVSVARKARAIAFEECARALTGQGGGLFSGRALADRIRALANTPPTMVVVERTMLESVLLRAGALLSEDGWDEENVRDIIDSIANALETK